MKTSIRRLALALASTGILIIYGCGGGGGGGAVATEDLTVTVIDGAIENATVCLDKNRSGTCDSGEPVGRTDAAGRVILKIDKADSGRFPTLAVVGTDAKDADVPGMVPVPFTLSAPADRPGLVSPLTTLVNTLLEGSGLTTAQAEALIKARSGVNISLFEDFTKGSSADHKAAGTLARMIVITAQQQTTGLLSSVGTNAIDGSKITSQSLDKAIQKDLLDSLASLKTAAADPTVLAATTAAAKETALLTQANAVAGASVLTAESVGTVVSVNNQAAAGTGTATALDQAKAFLALFDSSLATTVPGTGAARSAFSDGCYLEDGFTKAVSIALFDRDRVLSGEQNKFRVGSTRTNVQVLADRSITNPDGSTRRELDVKYDVNNADGTVFSNPSTAEFTTLISGSSSGSVLAAGVVCSTPESGSNLRFYGNRSIVNAVVRPFNQRSERYSLASGVPLASAVDYNRMVQFRISDPSNFATYAIVKGAGLPSAGYKLLSVRILRDDPLLAGKRNNYIDWENTDAFRICRSGTNGRAADLADCAGVGAQGNTQGAFNLAPAAADAAFDAIGFTAGAAYTIDVYNDDGWKTINGQAAKTPIASYTRVLRSLPYSAVALAGGGVGSDLYPRLTSSLSAVDLAAVFRSKAAATTNLSWTALGTMPDAVKYGFGYLNTYQAGSASATAAFWPQSRRSTDSFPPTGALGLTGYVVPAASSLLVTPNYAEIGLGMTNRNGGWITSTISFE